MLSYIAKRFIGMLIVMFLVVTAVFIIVRLTPGDPAAVMLGPDATAADIEALRQRLGLDRPILVQYLQFFANLLQGDLGRSIFLNAPVTTVLAERAEPTLFLTLFSLLIAVGVALPAGVYAACHRGSLFDQFVLGLAMLLASIPSFWMGLVLIQIFASGLGWMPASGYGGPDASFLVRLRHLILPSVTLGIVSSALILRFTRASMLDVLGDDYVRTARSKGASEFVVVMKHAFKNALVPIVTVIGLTAALLAAGAVVTETVFGLPGIGSLVVNAVLRRDYPVIEATLLVVAGLYVLINFLIDLLYLAIDPRVRF